RQDRREALERPRERVRTPAAGRAGGRQRDALLQHRGEQGSAARADRELPTAGTPRTQQLSAGTRARPLGATCPGTPPTAWHDCSTRTPPQNGGAVSSKRFPPRPSTLLRAGSIDLHISPSGSGPPLREHAGPCSFPRGPYALRTPLGMLPTVHRASAAPLLCPCPARPCVTLPRRPPVSVRVGRATPGTGSPIDAARRCRGPTRPRVVPPL